MTPRAIRLIYSRDYAVDIGNHVFPTSKYQRIKERLVHESGFGSRIEFMRPQSASEQDLKMVHDDVYLEKLKHGTLTREEVFRLELPYSKGLVRAAQICCGGTIAACDIASSDRIGIHIGGGFHHAFADHGEGFCVLNDIAVAIRHALSRGQTGRALVIDCDLHQGNGTAAIFGVSPNVFTFSIHQENNYPFFKPPSSLDIGLRDRAGDKEYLRVLQEHIPKIMHDFKPGLILYVAGADPYKDDRIGGLSLTKEGLRKRDEFIFNQALHYDVPIAVVLAGGYAYDEADIVDIHYTTIMTGLNLFYGKG